MNAPVFSLIMPAYNAEAHLKEALESVFAQETTFEYEVVLVDDGSTDGTADIAKGYPGLRYISQANSGAGAARNAGVSAARAPLILFLDADDRAMPDRFDIQVRHMIAEPGVDVCFGNWVVENESEHYLGRYGLSGSPEHFRDVSDALDRLLGVGCFVPTSTVALRRESFLRAGGFSADRHYAEDYALWCRIAASGGRFAFIDRQLGWYRTQSDTRVSLSTNTYLGFVQTMHEALLNYGSQLSPAAASKAADRYHRGLDVLLRHEWAYHGRAQVLRRMAELAPLVPADIERKYQLATFIPSIVPRTARRILHLLRRLEGGRKAG